MKSSNELGEAIRPLFPQNREQRTKNDRSVAFFLRRGRILSSAFAVSDQGYDMIHILGLKRLREETSRLEKSWKREM